MKNAKVLLLVVIMLTLAALACGPLGGGGQPSGGKATTPAGGGGGGVTPTKEPTAPPAEAEKDLDLSSVSEGLATLKSYKAAMNITFDGKDDKGQPVKGTMDWAEEFVKEPRAQHVLITSSGFSAEQKDQSFTMEMFTIGDMQYLIFVDQEGKKSCMASSSSDTQAEQGLFSPDNFGGISGAKYVKTETVNGVKAKRYAWKEGGLAGLGFTAGKGEVWVAVDGNYVVRYTAEATGKGAALFGGQGQEEGTVTLEYNVTDINKSFKIELPADAGCETPATDIPIMPDATDKATFGQMMSYNSASSFEDVVKFYQDEMPNAGWEASGEPMEMEGFAQLEFAKDTRKAQIMISYDKDKNTVSVTITTGE